ncbi:MAG: hypothetical protein HY332_17785 [Chloroflexi bacterium]|nr:hypothetical protein [Chloroflexota bacterium]
MERTYRASNGLYLYALFLFIDAVAAGWEAWRRFGAEQVISGALLALVAVIALFLAGLLVWRWGRIRVIITPEALIVRGELPVRRVYWADVDRVREIRGPSYDLSLRGLLPGPFLPHGIVRGETVLEVIARPGMRLVFRQALIEGYDAFRQDVLRSISKTAEVDIHARWWRDD